MAAILQTIFLFSYIKIFIFIQVSLQFPVAHLTINYCLDDGYGLDNGLAPKIWQAIIRTNDGPPIYLLIHMRHSVAMG